MRNRKGSIRKKIRRAFLIVSVISLAVSGAIAVIGMLNLRNAAVNSGNDIGGQAARSSYDALVNQALNDIAALSQAKAQVIDSELGKTAGTLENLAGVLSKMYQNSENYKDLPFNHPRFNTGKKREMQWMLSPGMTAATTGLEQDLAYAGVLNETFLQGNMQPLYETVMSADPSISSIYTTSKSGVNTGYDDKSLAKLSDNIATDVFECRNLTWYRMAAESLGAYVTDTYRDSFGRGLTVTMSTPYYGAGHEFLGVMGLDMLIDDLTEHVLSATVGESGYAVLLKAWNTDAAQIIAAPGLDEANEDNMRVFLGSAADEILNSMKANMSGVMESALSQGGQEAGVYVVWAQVKLTGWTYAFVVPTEDITAPSVHLRDDIGAMTDAAVRAADMQIVTSLSILAALILGVMAAVAFVAMGVSKRITGPVTLLASDIRAIGDGNLEYKSNIGTGDEIEDLSLSFQRMTIELKEYIGNLARVTAEKERIGAELDVANKIQASMLPSIFPPFPNRKEFDLYASMEPAKEVGGDFYDFFLVDDDTLAVVMADVSGKGVPAALFMVIAKTLIKNNAQSPKSPKEVFEAVNDILCENNDAGMFVTAILGYLDIPTGRFAFVNAGHNPPLLWSGGQFDWLKAKAGFVLAGMAGMSYAQHEVILAPGDELFLYTDGVTEAANHEGEFFGNQRLLSAVNRHLNLPLREFAVSVKHEIGLFAQGAEQADDITMLVLRYDGGQPTWTN